MIIYKIETRYDSEVDSFAIERVAVATVNGIVLELYLHKQTEEEIQESFQLSLEHAEESADYDLEDLANTLGIKQLKEI